MAVLGYNVILKINNKTIAGTTQDDFNITATTKESITKANQGAVQSSVVGHDITFSCSGIVEVTASGQTTTMSADDVLELAMKTGSQAIIPFTLTRDTGSTMTGNCVITSYGESAGSEDNANWSLNLKTTGTVTIN